MEQYILALDQGTTSSRAVIFNKKSEMISQHQKEYPQIYPQPGWVEHDPMDILFTQINAAVCALDKQKIEPQQIAALGISNQRETTIVWNRHTGRPVYNAIVWQCRRTSEMIDALSSEEIRLITEKTGLKPDAYFSATKIKWILDNVDGAREAAENGDLLFGTVDTWTMWNLTKGRVHATDYTNASRTMLFNINDLCWDREILKIFDIPECMMPQVYPSGHIYGCTDKEIFGAQIPIAAAAGDQQASLYGHCCFEAGDVKNTYGTGCFMLMNTGRKRTVSQNGLLTTIAAGCSEEVNYVLEGSIFIGGAVIQWLRDELNIIEDAAISEMYASRVDDTEGAYLVPAFAGLGAPYWNQDVRGIMVGLTRGFNKMHFVRAGLESIAYQVNDVIKAMEADAGIVLDSLKVDGGACANNFLMQFQSDITGIAIERPDMPENTSLGAAYLAGITTGYWKNEQELKENSSKTRRFTPDMDDDVRNRLLKGWKRAVRTACLWEEEE